MGCDVTRIYQDDPLDRAGSADGVIAIGKFSEEQIEDIIKTNDNVIFPILQAPLIPSLIIFFHTDNVKSECLWAKNIPRIKKIR